MKELKSKIAVCLNKWSLPVLVDEEGNVFYVVQNTNIKLPFITEEKYSLIDGHNLHSIVTKLIMSERKIAKLEKQVADNYSSDYLKKYFSETVVDLPNLDVVNKIITKYNKFSEITFMGEGIWKDRWDEVKKQEISHFEKDIAYIKIFMEFLTNENVII